MTDSISDVLHYQGLDFWNPAHATRIDTLLDLVPLSPGQRVLDVGCGNAEVLLRLAERYGTKSVGVDRSPHALRIAKAAFAKRRPDADVTFLQQDIQASEPPAGPFDMIVWMGGPFLGRDQKSTFETFARWVEPGGHVLIGAGFWAQPPPAEYLEATGLTEDEQKDHATNIAWGVEAGLVPLYTCVSTRDEWDHFEGVIKTNVERYALAHPDNPDPRGRLEQGRTWFAAQQRWGRDTMGFGFYLFARP